MQQIEPPDSHYLNAAIGWLELGNAKEAQSELSQLRSALKRHPDVLEVRWLVYAELGRWKDGLKVANLLVEKAPDRASGWLHRAYALRRVENGGLQQAWDALLPVVPKFPKEPTISYNLSCYACQMQQLDAARAWFKRAVSVGGKDQMKKMALQDPDLEPLWPEINVL
jgi:tetratricopeptide (TPR) repeat protein